MRKHAVVLTLTLLELLALLLLAFFWFVMRPDLAATYVLGDAVFAPSSALPTSTRVALTTWLVPAVGAGGALLFASAWLLRRGKSARNGLLGAALVFTVLGLTWAVWAAYAPAFERLSRAAPSIEQSPASSITLAELRYGAERRKSKKLHYQHERLHPVLDVQTSDSIEVLHTRIRISKSDPWRMQIGTC